MCNSYHGQIVLKLSIPYSTVLSGCFILGGTWLTSKSLHWNITHKKCLTKKCCSQPAGTPKFYLFIYLFYSWLFSPTKHKHIAGTRVIFDRYELLETQLLTAAIEAIRAVNASGVVIATWAILHWPQPLRTLRENEIHGKKEKRWERNGKEA